MKDPNLNLVPYQAFLTGCKNITGKAKGYTLVVGDRVINLVVNLLALILVERSYGEQGLGIFSFLLSVMIIGGYLLDCGMPRYVQRQMAAMEKNRKNQTPIMKNAFQATLLMGLLGLALFLLLALYGVKLTRIEDRFAGYLLIGLTVTIRNINGLRFAFLQGLGEHERAAKLDMARGLIFLGIFIILLAAHVPPSWLFISYLISEWIMTLRAWRDLPKPPLKDLFGNLKTAFSTLQEGSRALFTDDILGIALYIDFIILGIFVSARQLGLYSDASILIRFFLIIPISLRSVFRNRYCLLEAQHDFPGSARLMKRSASFLFYVHSVLAIYLLLFFPQVTRILFHSQEDLAGSFRVFTIILPALLYYSTVTVSEGLYDAQNRMEVLKNNGLLTAFLTLVLNIYLIPYAGLYGAAAATTVSMLVYFFLFGRGLDHPFRLDKKRLVLAGAVVYLTYKILDHPGWSALLRFLSAPILLLIGFYLIGFFDWNEE